MFLKMFDIFYTYYSVLIYNSDYVNKFILDRLKGGRYHFLHDRQEKAT